MIKRIVFLLSMCVQFVFGQSVSLHNFNTNQFATNAHSLPLPTGQWLINVNTNGVVTFGSINTNYLSTNGLVIQINTNLNSSFYQFLTNSIVQNASPQVWTNDGGVLKLVPEINYARVRMTNTFRIIGADGDTRYSDIGQADLVLADNHFSTLVEIYGYQRGSGPVNTGDGVGFFQMYLDSAGYGGTVAMDPANDNGLPQPFLFSTTYSNSIAPTDKLFAIANSHTNKALVMGNGDLYWGADATIGYTPPSTNAFPGQVWASSGGSPQQLYWTNLPAGGGSAQDLWRTNTVEGGIWWSNAPQVAKFGSYTSGFVAGQTNSGGTVEAQFGFGAIGIGYATGSGSLITSEGNGSLTYGETSAGGLIEGDGNGSTAAGFSTGSGSIINSIANGSFAGGKADLAGVVLAGNTATASMVYGYSSAGLLECLGSSTFLFGEADGAGSTMDNNGLGTLMVGRANHTGTFLAHGSGGITSGYVDFAGALDDGGALGSIANAFVTGTNSKSFNYPYGSLFTSAVREAGDVLFGVNQVVYQEGCLGAVAVNSAGIVRMNPAVGCFIGGLATSTNLLSANGTNTFTFGKNVGNTGDYAYSFGRDYTNTTPESFNVGWGSNVLQVTKTDLSVNGTINASLNSTLSGNQTSVTSGMATTTMSVTLTAGKTYTFQAELFLNDSTAADGAKIDFGGGSATATTFIAQVTAFDTALNLSSQLTSLTGVASASTFTGAGAFEVHGTIFVNQGGTLIPRFAQVNHSIGTLTLAKGSFIRFIQTP